MAIKYFYGPEGQEKYKANTLQKTVEIYSCGKISDKVTFVEMKVSRKSGWKWCKEHYDFIEDFVCGKIDCDSYEARNGKNGICKHQSWGLVATGRKWEVFPDGTYRKLSGRDKVMSKKTGHRICNGNKLIVYGQPPCGKWCDKYEPRNGKNGICRHRA